jgi:hypothetical protein
MDKFPRFNPNNDVCVNCVNSFSEEDLKLLFKNACLICNQRFEKEEE